MKLSYKLATISASVFFALLGVLFLLSTREFPSTFGIGPGYFPRILSSLLIVFSVVSGAGELFRKDEFIDLPKPANIVLVISSGVIFIALWHFLDRFYLSSFLVVSIMLFFLDPQPPSLKKAGKSIATGALIVVLVYFLFGKLLNFRF
jgi:hypothetical protein